MAAIEGVQRIYLLARRITFFGFIAGAALWGFALLLRVWLGIAVLFLLLSFPLALGAILWVIAWIVEGFVLPPKRFGGED